MASFIVRTAMFSARARAGSSSFGGVDTRSELRVAASGSVSFRLNMSSSLGVEK